MKISVIIPVFNVGELLRMSVESVLNQDYEDFEIIIVNDGSTDNSGRICNEYAHIPRITIIHKSNGGLSSARNSGIEVARGEYILFLDSDDYLRPGSLNLLANLINKNGDFDFIQFTYSELKDYSDCDLASSPNKIEIITDKREFFRRKLNLGGIGASACTKLISRKIFDFLKFKEGILHEDEQFTMRMIDISTKVLYIDNDLYMYVQRPGSIITSPYNHRRLDIVDITEEHIKILNKNHFEDLASEVRGRLFASLSMFYVQARRNGIKQDVKFIQGKLKYLMKEGNLPNLQGTINLIAIGIKYHIPVLQMYYLYKKWVR